LKARGKYVGIPARIRDSRLANSEYKKLKYVPTGFRGHKYHRIYAGTSKKQNIRQQVIKLKNVYERNIDTLERDEPIRKVAHCTVHLDSDLKVSSSVMQHSNDTNPAIF
jgi:hypothetical protein